MLLAIFIGSIILVVLYSSFVQIIKSKGRVEEELELYHEANIIMTKITKDLANTFPRGNVNAEEGNQSLYPYFIGENQDDLSTLRFTSLSRSPVPGARESDQSEISYYVEPIQGSDLLALMRGENPSIGLEEGERTYPISERVVAFNLAYVSSIPVIGQDNDEYLFEWDSTKTLALPSAVDIRLVLRNPRGEDIEFNTLVLIPVVN